MKILAGLCLSMLLLIAGVALGYAVGRSEGFSTGSEWAILQAEITAREAGVFMPVSYRNGVFQVTLAQPRGIYRRALSLAAFVASTEPQQTDHAGRISTLDLVMLQP